MDESQGPSEQALALAERFRDLGERRQGQPVVKPPRRKDPPRFEPDLSTTPPVVYADELDDAPKSEPDPPAAAPPSREQEVVDDNHDFVTRSAAEMAETLNDFHSMKFYQQVVEEVRYGRRMANVPRHVAFKQLFAKARELAELGKPERNIIRNPAAAFCAWWKKQT